MNTTELLSLIVKGMSKEGIELTDVKLYEEAVDINNEIKVCIANGHYIVSELIHRDGKRCWGNEDMVNAVLDLLKPTIEKGDYVTNGDHEGTLIQLSRNEYFVVNHKNNETVHCYTNSLKDLQDEGWRKV